MAVTRLPRVSQWAEMHRMAAGVGRVSATWLQTWLKELSSMAFIGLPCPTNKIGMRVVVNLLLVWILEISGDDITDIS